MTDLLPDDDRSGWDRWPEPYRDYNPRQRGAEARLWGDELGWERAGEVMPDPPRRPPRPLEPTPTYTLPASYFVYKRRVRRLEARRRRELVAACRNGAAAIDQVAARYLPLLDQLHRTG